MSYGKVVKTFCQKTKYEKPPVFSRMRSNFLWHNNNSRAIFWDNEHRLIIKNKYAFHFVNHPSYSEKEFVFHSRLRVMLKFFIAIRRNNILHFSMIHKGIFIYDISNWPKVLILIYILSSPFQIIFPTLNEINFHFMCTFISMFADVFIWNKYRS